MQPGQVSVMGLVAALAWAHYLLRTDSAYFQELVLQRVVMPGGLKEVPVP